MQDAYFQEKNDIGGWGDIGYSGPGTRDNTSSYHSNVFGYAGNSCGGSTACTWTAVPKVDLNDCKANTSSAWVATATLSGSAGSAGSFQITTSGAATCTPLTASWSSLSRASN